MSGKSFGKCDMIETLTEGFPCFFVGCKANARVKPAKRGTVHTLLKFLYCSVYCLICVVPYIFCV